MRALVIITTLIAVVLFLPTTATAQVPVECEEEYTVQAGDWLSKISEKYYGDPLVYPALLITANAVAGDTYTDIPNPDLIEPGWMLCIPSGEDAADLLAMSVAPAPAGLVPVDLMNATYLGIYEEPVTLADGKYEGEPFVPGGASRPTVTFIDTPLGYGDVTGDGQTDAVVLLAENSGGSGTFVYLAVVVTQEGRPVNVGTILLGDRVQVEAINVANNQILVDLVQPGPDDPLCCPSQQVIKTFELQGDQLVEVSSEAAGAAGSPGLVGPVWQWDETIMNNDDTFTPDKPSDYTIEFKPDGTVHINADCNTANGTYTVDGSSITLNEPLAMTMAACPPGSLSDEFVKQLTGIAIYFFEGDNLYFDLKFDSGTMRFSPMKVVELPGSAWVVRGYNNGQGAQAGVVSVIMGTEMTAVFDANGQVTGSAGCNNYSAGYKTQEQEIAIGPAIVTRMFCDEPAGIMEQEQLYLAALEMAKVYTIDGERLQMRTAQGSLVADFVSAVTGNVTYPQRIALPEDAMMQVQLQDTSLADAPAGVLAEFLLTTQGRQVPLPFAVTYNQAEIDPGHAYALNVRITDRQGNLLFVNTRVYNVITQENPAFGIEVVVEPV